MRLAPIVVFAVVVTGCSSGNTATGSPAGAPLKAGTCSPQTFDGSPPPTSLSWTCTGLDGGRPECPGNVAAGGPCGSPNGGGTSPSCVACTGDVGVAWSCGVVGALTSWTAGATYACAAGSDGG